MVSSRAKSRDLLPVRDERFAGRGFLDFARKDTVASLLVYGGAIVAATGALRNLWSDGLSARRTRGRRAESPPLHIAAGLGLTVAGFLLPPVASRAKRITSKLDEVMPEWEFNEVHSLHIDAPPDIVFDAVRNVRANEITLFHTLTWIRRFGRELPESILNARDHEPLLDVATRTGFEWLANDPPRELVVGTCLIGPDRRAYGAVNFVVTPEGRGSRVTTETRVHAKDAHARRRFAVYWRIIYPGSALIRRMWLRAVRERATGSATLSSAE